jgi:small conductance mechanosensitive channel
MFPYTELTDLQKIALSVAKIALVVAGYIIIRMLIHKIATRLLRPAFDRVADRSDARTERVRALETILRSSADFVLGFIAFVMLLQILGLNIVPLITTAGVAGLAVGFGAQKLIRDVIGGFFIVMEDQYGVGDYVSVGAITGTVKSLGMRTTSIMDAQGRLTVISNGLMDQVCNHSRGTYSLLIDFAIVPEADPDSVRRVLSEALSNLQSEMTDDVGEVSVCEGFTAISGTSRTYRCEVHVKPVLSELARCRLCELVSIGLSQNGIALV